LVKALIPSFRTDLGGTHTRAIIPTTVPGDLR
jgi:hypothetical protein